MTDKLTPHDPRVKYETAQVRGKTYGYLVGEGADVSRGTAVLVHGFPDLSFGWRYQIPHLMSLGYRVVAPDMLGYGGTDAPADESAWAHKSQSDDLAELARRFVGPDGQIVLGGHDWGGALVWKLALWHPKLIRAVFSVCTPFVAPRREFIPLEAAIAAGKLHNFRYQLQFKGPELQEAVRGREKVRQFLNALYGGRTPDGQPGFTTDEGVIIDRLPLLGPTPLATPEELDHVADRYMLRDDPQLRGPLNWYRVNKYNYDDELALLAARDAAGTDPKAPWIHAPALYVAASRDSALPPALSQGMEALFDSLDRAEVVASHWALTQAAGEVNAEIEKFLTKVDGPKAAL